MKIHAFFCAIAFLSLDVLASECNFIDNRTLFEDSEAIVVGEKLYSGKRFPEFLGDFPAPLDIGRIYEKWVEYRKQIDYVEFLIEAVHKGQMNRLDIIKVPNTPVLEKTYNVGNRYLVFLSREDGGWTANTCLRVDLDLRQAVVDFKRLDGSEYSRFIRDMERFSRSDETQN